VIDGEWRYGIIDYQQQWSWRKRVSHTARESTDLTPLLSLQVEAWVKTSLLGQRNISCAPPKEYRDRSLHAPCCPNGHRRQLRFIESTLKRVSSTCPVTPLEETP
jgi:hypothetical protein